MKSNNSVNIDFFQFVMNRRRLGLAGLVFKDGFTTLSPGDVRSSFGEGVSKMETILTTNFSVNGHVKMEVIF